MRSKPHFLIATASFLVFSALDTCEVMASKRHLEENDHSGQAASRNKMQITYMLQPLPQHENNGLQPFLEEIAEGQAPSTPVQQTLSSRDLEQQQLDKAILRFERETDDITDVQAVQYFQQTLNSQHLTQEAKDDAALGLALMCYKNRTAVVTDAQAVKMLGKIISSSDNVDDIKKAADLTKKLADRM